MCGFICEVLMFEMFLDVLSEMELCLELIVYGVFSDKH